jgi:hypothetical protein
VPAAGDAASATIPGFLFVVLLLVLVVLVWHLPGVRQWVDTRARRHGPATGPADTGPDTGPVDDVRLPQAFAGFDPDLFYGPPGDAPENPDPDPGAPPQGRP